MLDERSMAELLELFLLESEEGLEATEGALLVLEREPDDAEALSLAFRGVHTIKGNAGIFDFHALGAVAHAMEDLLDRIRGAQTRTTAAVIDTLLDAVDVLRSLLGEDERARPIGPLEQKLIDRLTGSSLYAGTTPSITPSALQRKTHTLRIEIDRLDRLLDLTGEIGVARGRITQMLESDALSTRSILEAHRDADLLHAEMQELVMKLRMVPVGPSFRQLHRIVRDAAQSVGKSAELSIEGGEVEVDMTIVEHLRDPLAHMIRNSVGHGIETRALRLAAGKPASGSVRLRSFHDAGAIVIELSDDGAGIDRSRIVEKAVQRGLIASGQTLSEGEMMDLIFHPGFSTAARVTELSGRGVGLDVVRRNIDAIHGSVSVKSRPGEGTTFTLRLPLTLATVDGLLVQVAGQPFIIPMSLVVEAVRLPEDVDPTIATGVLRYREATIPFLRLRHRLSALHGGAVRENVVIVRHSGACVGLVVDLLEGECQTVVKPLPRSIRRIPGLSGSTILANGAVAFIVDVFSLLQIEVDRSRTHLRQTTTHVHQESSCSTN